MRTSEAGHWIETGVLSLREVLDPLKQCEVLILRPQLGSGAPRDGVKDAIGHGKIQLGCIQGGRDIDIHDASASQHPGRLQRRRLESAGVQDSRAPLTGRRSFRGVTPGGAVSARHRRNPGAAHFHNQWARRRADAEKRVCTHEETAGSRRSVCWGRRHHPQ